MMGSNFAEEIDCGSFFDHFDDLIEFPQDDETAMNFDEFPVVISGNSEGSQGNDIVCPGGGSANTGPDLSAELAVPYEDIVQLEWLSTFMEDSFSGGGMTLNCKIVAKKSEPSSTSQGHFRTSSPVSVLESSSSTSGNSFTCGKTIMLSPTIRGPQRARTKRPRPATFSPRHLIHLPEPHNGPLFPLVSTDSVMFDAVNASGKADDPEQKEEEKKKKKKKKKRVSVSQSLMETDDQGRVQGWNLSPPAARKCLHCEITKTPQWRAGPMGPKTLCNACGVRYKSGRLFPEYRPAASPTFLPSVHSNSHKKVMEMRTKGVTDVEPDVLPPNDKSTDCRMLM